MKIKDKKLNSVLLILIMLTIVLGCNGETETPSPTPKLIPITITIGNITDETGVYSEYISIADMALEDMVAYYNENDLISGVELEVISYDTEYDPSKYVPAYQQLKADGADLYFSSLPDLAESIGSQIEQDEQVLFISGASGVNDNQASSRVFYFGTHPKYEAYTILTWIAENDWDYNNIGPAKVGGITLDSYDYTDYLLDSAKKYAEAHPDQFDWAVKYVHHYTWVWNPAEEQELLACDYVFLPIPIHSFVEVLREAGSNATLLGTNSHLNLLGMVDDSNLWQEFSGSIFSRSGKWWQEDGAISNLATEILNNEHPETAEDTLHQGSVYLDTFANVYMLLQIIADTSNVSGVDHLDTDALYHQARSFSTFIDGCPHSFTSIKRTSSDAIGIYRIDASTETLVRADPDWIPIVTEP